MDVKQMLYMVTIAQEGGISKAAAKLFITQSALDQQLLKLEHELGTPLFYRSRSSFSLTEAGRVYVDYAQRMLEDMGLTVTVQKEYCEDDGSGNPVVSPGYVLAVSPEEGRTVNSGESVTLTVSRGLDFADGAQVPSVIGMSEDDALTTLGKWIDIEVVEEQNAEVPAGEVIDQSIEAYSYADPDEPISITVSSGDQEPGAAEEETAQDVNDTELEMPP